MKADLYVQGHQWATINIPETNILDLLAKGIITNTEPLATRIQHKPLDFTIVSCSITIRIKQPVAYPPNTDNPP